MLRKMQLCWKYFLLFPGSDRGPRGPTRVILAPLWWLEMELKGGVGVGMNQVCLNMSLTIQSDAMVKAAVLGVFRVVSGLWLGPRHPLMCESGSNGMDEIDL